MLESQVIPNDPITHEYFSGPEIVPPDPATTLLDTKETSGIFPERVSWRAASGHFDSQEYSRIQSAYAMLDELEETRREVQLLNCHTLAYFARHKETGEVKIISQSCNLRWCPVCSKSKQALITKNVSNWLRMFKHPKILTLTKKHAERPLKEQIGELYKNFQNLRKRKFFKSAVTGGVWFFQIKRSKTDGLWHPHIHCLITGLFLPRDKLSKLWLKITGDSPVCDVRAVKDPDSACRHVARYATSPANLDNLSACEIAEIIQACHGRRFLGTWGLAKSISFKREPQSDKDSWESVGGWWSIMDFRTSDSGAKEIFRCWKNSEPLDSGISIFNRDLLSSGGMHFTIPPPENPLLF